MAKHVSVLGTIRIMFLGIFFLAAQGLHAVVATSWVCHVQAVTPGSSHNCGQERQDSDQGGQGGGGCCCGDSAACGCELNQGRSAERQNLPVAIAGYGSGHVPVDPGATSSQIAVIPNSIENTPLMGGIQARAPSESRSLSTVKILC